MRKITIVGGGASGTLLAVNLSSVSAETPLSITLVESRSRIGRGVAFSTKFDCHLLNVPAGKMSAFPDEPDHFLNWLTSNGHGFEASDFVPRRLFGEYLTALLDERCRMASGNVRFASIEEEAVSLEVNGSTSKLHLASGTTIDVDAAVLAFGNFLPPHPTVPDLSFISANKYIRDVWADDAFETVQPDDQVLIVGTGLSMVDVVLRLRSSGHKGKITSISTRGLLPAVHKLGFHYDPFFDEIRGSTRITEIFTAVRKHARRAGEANSDWRAVIDSLRPYTQRLWQGLPIAEKRYFLQHLSRYWNAARHRMPPAVAAVIDEMQKEGSLEIVSGRLRHISIDNKGDFLVNAIRDGEQSYLNANVLVNCIASQSNFAHIESEFVRDLLAKGLISCDPLCQGLDATPDGQLLNAAGEPSVPLWTLGTALKGTLWETTAIPEIRVQAAKLAKRLVLE
ncbi:MAG TPA: FAD/NAD(P)-binding protein [Pyrinomonadaceae bacterium]|nr:FAD/NAD(P)-binding protein [Pyrinomonadaceae bacterium]